MIVFPTPLQRPPFPPFPNPFPTPLPPFPPLPVPLPVPPMGQRKYANVFVFPAERVVDPSHNVYLVANLWNFGIGKTDVLADHKYFLQVEVAPLLLGDPAAGARLVGLASRSGSDQMNLQLGKRRAENTKGVLAAYIRAADMFNPPGPPERITTGSQGERFAERVGARDGTEEARYRSVLVTVLRDRRRPTNVQLLPG